MPWDRGASGVVDLVTWPKIVQPLKAKGKKGPRDMEKGITRDKANTEREMTREAESLEVERGSMQIHMRSQKEELGHVPWNAGLGGKGP